MSPYFRILFRAKLRYVLRTTTIQLRIYSDYSFFDWAGDTEKKRRRNHMKNGDTARSGGVREADAAVRFPEISAWNSPEDDDWGNCRRLRPLRHIAKSLVFPPRPNYLIAYIRPPPGTHDASYDKECQCNYVLAVFLILTNSRELCHCAGVIIYRSGIWNSAIWSWRRFNTGHQALFRNMTYVSRVIICILIIVVGSL